MQDADKPDDLPGRLRGVVQLKGWRQADLQELLGCNLDRVKSLMSGKVRRLYAEEVDALVDKAGVRREFLATGEPPILKTEQELAVERQLDGLGQATALVRELDAPDWVRRVAQEWVFAVLRRDSARVQELAQQAISHVAEERVPYKVNAQPPDPGPVPDRRLEPFLAAVLEEIDRQGGGVPPAKVAALVSTLLDVTPPGSAVNPAQLHRLVRLAV